MYRKHCQPVLAKNTVLANFHEMQERKKIMNKMFSLLLALLALLNSLLKKTLNVAHLFW